MVKCFPDTFACGINKQGQSLDWMLLYIFSNVFTNYVSKWSGGLQCSANLHRFGGTLAQWQLHCESDTVSDLDPDRVVWSL